MNKKHLIYIAEEIVSWIAFVLLIGGIYFVSRSFFDWRFRVNMNHYVKNSCLR